MALTVEGSRHADEDNVRALVHASADAMIIVDDEGTVLFVNPAASDLLGRTSADLVGSTFGSPMTPGDRTEIDVLSGGEPRIAEMRVTELQWDGHPARLAALRDVTERRAMERWLRDFASTVSHEIRSPLIAVSGLVDLLLDDLGHAPEDEIRDLLQRSAGQLDNLRRIVNDLLTLARLDAGQLKVGVGPVPLGPLLREVRDVHDGLRLTGPDDTMVLADRGFLSQVVENLVVNAEKYGEAPFQIEVEHGGRGTRIRVCDHGDGVDPAFVPELFERFSRSSSSGTGTGLGLAIAQGLIRAMGGVIRYERNEPRGAAFVVELPVPDGDDAPE